MSNRINFDNESNLGYIYVFNKKVKYSIEETEELEVNPFISLDVDKEQRVVGLELFGQEATKLENYNYDQIYSKRDNAYLFMIDKDKKSLSTYSFLGLEFLFTEPDYKGFNGYQIVDTTKYSETEIL